jgi:NAD(P)-dependent dehydrogenase (short-subunit alcohol dehydrogenase family)
MHHGRAEKGGDMTGTALITGASRGIGAATARILAQAGWRVGLFARDAAALTALARDTGGLAVPGDVADPRALGDAEAQVQDRWGPVTLLVNNAALIAPMAPWGQIDPAAWDRLMAVNLGGVLHGIQAVLPGMQAAGGGTIITLSSGAAHRPVQGWAAYCASKAAVAMLTKSLHLELGDQGILAMGLSPGTVATDMQRAIKASGIGPVADLDWSDHIPPEWVARTILWMAQPENARANAGQELSLRDIALRQAVGLA